jgi:RNA polymerase sigma-70 factor (ECF subfamily)
MTRLVLHLDAAYNLARWLTRNDLDAEDVVQEAYLRAFTYLRSFQGGDGKAWLLTIVRNTYYSWLKHNRVHEPMVSFDEEFHGVRPETTSQETTVLDHERERILKQAMDDLPAQYREVLVLREIEGLSYQEVANTVGVPIGTVMSRISRARKRLHQRLGVPAGGARLEITRELANCSGDREGFASGVAVGV